MVLDSVIDPALTFNQISQGQAGGFESSLQSFFSWCAGTSGCPWRPAAIRPSALLALLGARRPPVPAGERSTAGAGQLYDALLDGPLLPGGLAPARRRAGGRRGGQRRAGRLACPTLQHERVVQRQRRRHGHRLPRPPRVARPRLVRHLADALQGVGAGLRPLARLGRGACAVWPAPPTRPVGPVAAAGAPPILVVGTTGDPATPYQWAVRRGPRTRARLAPHPRRRRPRGVLLQRAASGRRADVSRERGDAAGGHVCTS